VQFQLTGFEPGDPTIADPARRDVGSGASGPLPQQVDVPIIGCGPAGLTLAAQFNMSRMFCRLMVLTNSQHSSTVS
jgi:hypothetical protein